MEYKNFFLVYDDKDKCLTHTFLTFEKDNKYYWFEHAFERFKGIHEYFSMKELLFDIRNKFIQYKLNDRDVNEEVMIYEYKKPNYHISVLDFYNHCTSGVDIDLDKL